MLIKKLIPIFLILIVASFVLADDVEVTRDILDGVLPGETVDVVISVDVLEDVSSVIITENVPEGWEIVKTGANKFEGKMKWLVYGSSLQDSFDLSYTLKAPVDFSEATEVEGNWKTLHNDGFINGDAVFVMKTIKVNPVEANSNYGLYIVVIVALALILILV